MVTQSLLDTDLLSGSSVKTAVGSVLLSCRSCVNISSSLIQKHGHANFFGEHWHV